MLQIFVDPVSEGAILVVNIEQIVGDIVVGNVDIGPSVEVNVGDGDTQAKPLNEDTRFASYISERVPIVAIESVIVERGAVRNLRTVRGRHFSVDEVGEQV